MQNTVGSICTQRFDETLRVIPRLESPAASA